MAQKNHGLADRRRGAVAAAEFRGTSGAVANDGTSGAVNDGDMGGPVGPGLRRLYGGLAVVPPFGHGAARVSTTAVLNGPEVGTVNGYSYQRSPVANSWYLRRTGSELRPEMWNVLGPAKAKSKPVSSPVTELTA
jgi:hypothetical protein